MVEKLNKLLKKGVMNEDVTRCLPGMGNLRFQGLIKKECYLLQRTSSPFWKFGQGISQPRNGNSKNRCDLIDRIKKIVSTIEGKTTYRTGFLIDLGLVNQPIKLDIKIICTLESNMGKFSEWNIKFYALPSTEPGA